MAQNPNQSSNVNIPGGTNQGTIDVRDMSDFLSDQETINKKLLEDTYGNINDLQKNVSKAQMDFMKDFYSKQQQLEETLSNSRKKSDIEKASLQLSILREQKEAFRDVAAELKKVQEEEKEILKSRWNFFTLGFTGFLENIKKSYKEGKKEGGGGISGALMGAIVTGKQIGRAHV